MSTASSKGSLAMETARLKAARFDRPDFIPVSFGASGPTWDAYPHDFVREQMAAHPLLFPDYKPGDEPWKKPVPPWQVAGKPYRDDWGCIWETLEDGITGTVVRHPLEDWEALERFVPPDPEVSNGLQRLDWTRVGEEMKAWARAGHTLGGGLPHGHTFLRLCDLRGYQNLMFDMADEDPRLLRLIEMVEAFNAAIVRKYLAIGVTWMSYPEDLGMQVGPMLSPDHFRRYIQPTYQRLIRPAREAGCIIHMHSDGDLRQLANPLLEGGVQVLNLQDRVNGIDWIRTHLKGKVAIELDIDRQNVTRFGKPSDIDALVRDAVRALGSPEGGLMLTYGLYPGIPLANVAAVMDAMEKYADYWN